jgi:hypothetical protein
MAAKFKLLRGISLPAGLTDLMVAETATVR